MVYSSGLRLLGRRQAWAGAWLLALIALLITLSFLPASRLSAQQGLQPSATVLRLARDHQLLQDAGRLKLSTGQIGRLWAEIASDEQDLGHFDQAEEAYNHALKLFEPQPELRLDYAVTLNNLGTLYAIRGDHEASLNSRKRVLAILEKLGDPLAIARAQSHLADAYLGLNKNKEARRYAETAYRALEALPQAKKQDKASVLVAYSYASCMTGHCAEGLEAIRRARALTSETYPPDAFAIGQVLVAQGFAEWRTGDRVAAETDLREGIRILRVNLPPEHPFVVQALEIYRSYLSDGHRDVEARQVAEETKGIVENARRCSSCTVSIYSLRAR